LFFKIYFPTNVPLLGAHGESKHFETYKKVGAYSVVDIHMVWGLFSSVFAFSNNCRIYKLLRENSKLVVSQISVHQQSAHTKIRCMRDLINQKSIVDIPGRTS